MQVVGNVLSKDAGISLDFNPLQIESPLLFISKVLNIFDDTFRYDLCSTIQVIFIE